MPRRAPHPGLVRVRDDAVCERLPRHRDRTDLRRLRNERVVGVGGRQRPAAAFDEGLKRIDLGAAVPKRKEQIITSQSNHSVGTSFGESELRSVMESLSYLTERFFESRVICADPGGTCNRISDTIHFLRRNFQREEEMMDIVGYPEAALHKKEHEDLLLRLTELKRTLVCSGYDNAMLFDLITDWKKNHIPRFDEPLGRYLHELEMNSTSGKGL